MSHSCEDLIPLMGSAGGCSRSPTPPTGRTLCLLRRISETRSPTGESPPRAARAGLVPVGLLVSEIRRKPCLSRACSDRQSLSELRCVFGLCNGAALPLRVCNVCCPFILAGGKSHLFRRDRIMIVAGGLVEDCDVSNCESLLQSCATGGFFLGKKKCTSFVCGVCPREYVLALWKGKRYMRRSSRCSSTVFVLGSSVDRVESRYT